MTLSRPLLALLATIWLVCGVIIGLNPAPGDGPRAQVIPLVGWLLAAFAGFVLFKVRREAVTLRGTPNTPPRHSNGRDASSNGQVVRHGLAAAFSCVVGVFSLGMGIAEGSATHFCLGVAALTGAIPMVAYVSTVVRGRVGGS